VIVHLKSTGQFSEKIVYPNGHPVEQNASSRSRGRTVSVSSQSSESKESSIQYVSARHVGTGRRIAWLESSAFVCRAASRGVIDDESLETIGTRCGLSPACDAITVDADPEGSGTGRELEFRLSRDFFRFFGLALLSLWLDGLRSPRVFLGHVYDT